MLVSAGKCASGEPERATRELTVYWVDEPPVIDGDLSDPLWQRLPRVTGLADITFRNAYVLDQTLFTVAYDSENIYFAVDCRDRFPNRIKATVTERDGNFRGVGDETVQIFMDPFPTGRRYIWLKVNPLGTSWDSRKGHTDALRTAWDGEWDTAAKRTTTGWTAEIAFPLANMPMETPAAGFRLKANLFREHSSNKTDGYSSWSWITSGYHSRHGFGEWIFAGPERKGSRADEMRINQDFVRAERRRLESLSVQTGRESARINQLPSPTRTAALNKLIEQGAATAATLSGHTASAPTLDALFEARDVGHELATALERVSVQSSRSGLAGAIDGLNVTDHGIKRHGKYWVLSGERGVYAIAGESGTLAGVWDRKASRHVIAASYDLYAMETMDDEARSDERFDVVETVEQEGAVLNFSCRNPHLAGLRINKRYELHDGGKMLSKRVAVSADVEEMTLLGISSQTIFDPDFRAESLYNRMMSAGANIGSDRRPTIPAEQITGKIVQRAGNRKAAGWAQFVLANTGTHTGVAQYLYKMNDQYVWFPYGMTSSYWDPHGWEISVLGTFLEREPFSAEVRYHLFDGDQIEFYHEYLELPEVVAARAELPVSPHIAGLRYGGAGGMARSAFGNHYPDGVNPLFSVPHGRLRSDEISMGFGIPRHDIYSLFPSTDEEDIVWVDPHTEEVTRVDAGEVREAVRLVKERFPRHTLSAYWVHTDLHPDTEAFKDHPEFAIQLKNGNLALSEHPYWAYEADMLKEFTDYVVPRYAGMVDHLGLDYLYFDFFGGSSFPDWGQGRVQQTTDYMYFDRSIREMLEERDLFLFFNGNPGHLYVDINYAELQRSNKRMLATGKDWWRWHRERLMHYKLMERENMATILIFWIREANDRDYTNAILALGLRPHSCQFQYDEELKREDGTIDYSRRYNYEEPYHQVSLEMHNAHIANVGLAPRYWTDPDSTMEAYVLRKGPAYFFTVINHGKETSDLTASAEVTRLGFQSGRRLFRWDYVRRDDTKVSPLIGPETPGWDRLFTSITCSSSILGDDSRIHVTFPDAEVNYTYLATLTQVPGVFVSVEEQELQLRIPHVLRCSLDGEVDEAGKRVMLRAHAGKPGVVAVWWPDSWGIPQLEVNGRRVDSPRPVRYGHEQFVLAPVEKGDSQLELSVE